tara:strand:+ start:551 stop:2380 length:1830 start_codon:yes stop_codon:yes gene_type:complete
MKILFNRISSSAIPFLKILRILKFDVYYININGKNKEQKNKLSLQLKKINILPIPVSSSKEIPADRNFGWDADPAEKTFAANKYYISDNLVEFYCNLLKTSKKSMRLILQDFLSINHRNEVVYLEFLKNLFINSRIVFISFELGSFFTLSKNTKTTKIILPLDFFGNLFKLVKKFIKKINITKYKASKYKSENNKFSRTNVALVTHHGLNYGSMYEKTHYYSENEKSEFHKKNILHLDYSNFESPNEDLQWFCINKNNTFKIKILFKVIKSFFYSLKFVKNLNTFYGTFLLSKQYYSYLNYFESMSKFKNLKIALIEYDCLCPKTLIAALQANKIRVITIQDRFVHTFYTSFANVIADTYFVASEKAQQLLENSKYCDVKKFIPIGLPKSEWIKSKKKKNIPTEIIGAIKEGKKVIVSLGHHSADTWYESAIDPVTNWKAQTDFLENMIKLAKELDNVFIIVRYKYIDWLNNDYFSEIKNKIKVTKNIIISQNYEEFQMAYSLCANADLIIAKHTSLAEECYINKIPILFYDFTHNMKKIINNIFNYPPENISCYDFYELETKVKILLSENSNNLSKGYQMMDRLLYVKNNENIKDKIINFSQNLIYSK